MQTSLAQIDHARQILENVTGVEEARKLLSLAQGILTVAQKEYRASDRIEEVKMDRDEAYRVAVKAGEFRLLAEARLGELLERELRGVGRPQENGRIVATISLKDIGLTKSDSSRAQQIATHQDLISVVVARAIERKDVPTRKDMETVIKESKGESLSVHFSSKSGEWNTPRLIWERVIQVMGGIDLDPCSNRQGTPNVPALRYFTCMEDGLSSEWFGRVYMNPPYGNEISRWVDKLIGEYQVGRVTQAIALVPSRTDTLWFRGFRPFPRCFLWGRLSFGEAENGAPFPSMVVYLGKDLAGFIKGFGDIGDVYQFIGNYEEVSPV